jgi:AMP-binding enzyme/AMP-binding enzyme C-terminal domain
MRGYFGEPAETAEAFAGGWVYFGDLRYCDEDSNYSIVDRKKDLIIRGGYNVYPREVKEVLFTHPAVASAAVVGVPDDRVGEEIKAFVQPRGRRVSYRGRGHRGNEDTGRGVQVPADGGVPGRASHRTDRQRSRRRSSRLRGDGDTGRRSVGRGAALAKRSPWFMYSSTAARSRGAVTMKQHSLVLVADPEQFAHPGGENPLDVARCDDRRWSSGGDGRAPSGNSAPRATAAPAAPTAPAVTPTSVRVRARRVW